jgi:2-C-methyl-D-erythritol 4-phosphate cytidylyltransferase
MVAWAASTLAIVCPRIVITAPAEAVEDMVKAVAHVAADITVVAGSDTRQRSVAAGIAALGTDAQEILVHDAARPFMPAGVMGAALAELSRYDGVIPVLPVVDTVVAGVPDDVRYLKRASLGAVQTPQAFRAGPLRDAHARAAADGIEATDDGALLMHYGYTVGTCAGDAAGRKVTYPEDLAFFEERMLAP